MTRTIAGPFDSATSTAALLASGAFSSQELVEAQIARIEKHDAKLNAVVVRDFERAVAASAAADKALRRGDRRPLLGVPITVKESFNVAGLPTHWGVPAFRNWTPRVESLAIRKLRRAGAVIIGKTNVSEALSDWQCWNGIFGRTNNPWDLNLTCGGSSGGSAAAVAAGFSFLEIGSDVAGSIRIPAHFCGVFGHRPTFGILPTQGYSFPSTVAQSDLSTIGPLARTAADLMLAFDLLAGPGEQESIAYSMSVPKARCEKLEDYRVLILQEHPLAPTAAAALRPVTSLASALSGRGTSVAFQTPLLPDLAEVTQNCIRLLVPMTLARVADEEFNKLAEEAKRLHPEDNTLAAIGLRAGTGSYRDWTRANEVRARLFNQWRALFREFDVVICPVSPTVAFPHDGKPFQQRTLEVDGARISYMNQIAWATLATGCGLPATTVPFQFPGESLPTSLQIIGPHLEDRTTLHFAHLLERHFTSFIPPLAFRA